MRGDIAAPIWETEGVDFKEGYASYITDEEEIPASSEDLVRIQHEEDAATYAKECAEEEFFRRARLTNPALTSGNEMMTKVYPLQRYLIGPKLLPKGGRMLLTAKNGTGKSALTLNMVASIITGRGLFGFKHTHKDKDFGTDLFPTAKGQTCLYLDYEIPEGNRKEERLAPLVKIFGQDFLKSLFFPKHPSDYRLENGRNEGSIGSFDRLYTLVKETRPSILVIDPFSSTHSVDENSSAIKQPLNAIDRLIDISAASVILVHHESTKILRDFKGNQIEKGTKEKARGHSALTDWADLHLSIDEVKQKGAQSSEKTLALNWGKTRYCKTPLSRSIKFNFETMAVAPLLRGDSEE